MALFICIATPALHADGLRRDDDVWPVRAGGRLNVDGGLTLGPPVALGTGLSTGLGANVLFGRTFAFGLRASWSTATESDLTWTVTQMDMRLHAIGAIQHAVGRGRFGLRLGLGPTLVHEDRVRNQGARAGLSGSALETSASRFIPSGELELVVAVHIAGPWLLVTSGGPAANLVDGSLRGGWVAQIGVGWQP